VGILVRHAAMIFAPVRRLIFHGAHKPALRRKRAQQAQAARVRPSEFRQTVFAFVVFVEEFEFVLAKMEV
jgi:hypothetical protein